MSSRDQKTSSRCFRADSRTTDWSMVLMAACSESVQGADALEKLCKACWYLLYSFILRQGYAPDQAQDLAQEFFGRLLGKDWLQAVDRVKGRFRSFLLATAKRFLSKERQKTHAAKRGGGVSFIYQGCVTTVEKLKPGSKGTTTNDWEILEKWPSALWQCHDLFQEAVNDCMPFFNIKLKRKPRYGDIHVNSHLPGPSQRCDPDRG